MQRGDELAGRYRLDKLIGSGGMGEVWQGYDLRLRRMVAVKVLLATWAKEPQALARFHREAEAAAQLDHHPAIATIYDLGDYQGCPFLVLELLRGEDFRTVLARTPAGLPIELVLSYGVQIADGLTAAHQAGVVHRDIKPANLMLLAGGRVKICDFGVAHLEGATAGLTATGHAIGTPAYMAPEQWAGQKVDGRTDLYSLGCVLYELLTGQRPFQLGQPPSPIPADLEAYLLKLLAKDPEQRPPTASAVVAELRVIADRYQKALAALTSRIRDLLADAERLARTLTDPRSQAEALREIMKVAAGWDPGEARRLLADVGRIASSLDPPQDWYVLEDVVEVAAGLDLDDAGRIAHSLSDSWYQFKALMKILKLVPVRDVSKTRQLLAEAERIALTTSDPKSQSIELRTIAEVAAEWDPDGARRLLADAERVAHAITDPKEQAGPLCWIAKAVAGLDSGAARRLLADAERLAHTITNPSDQITVLRWVAEATAELDAGDAERVASAITDLRSQVKALQEIAQVVAARDPGKARQMLADAQRLAGTLTDSYAGYALEDIAEIMADLDPDLAEQITQTLTDPYHRCAALRKIAKKVADQDPGKAQRLLADAEPLAHTIWNDQFQTEAFYEIARLVAEWDPGKAQQLLAEAERVAHTITHPWSNDRVLTEIAEVKAEIATVVARRDPADAERIAHTINSPRERDEALLEVAKVVAARDSGDAERIARTLEWPTPRPQDRALAKIAAVVAGRDPADAERIARTITDPEYEAEALWEIAKVVVQQGLGHGQLT
ncbi:MAG: repeat-containing protein [Actinomycetia bacterium]|nr:repeat-containing protein [Actinomycetes bacterium]